LFKISKTLGVDVSFFFEGVENLGESEIINLDLSDISQVPFKEDPMSSREAIELMHNYYRVTDENVRKRLSQFIKTLAQSSS